MSQLPPSNLPDRPCPNCGQIIPAGLQYCSLCGYGARYPSRKPGSGSSIALVLAFALVGIPSALCGGCFLLMGGGSPSGIVPAIVGFSVFGLLLWSVVNSRRRE